MTRDCTELVTHMEQMGVFQTQRQVVAPGQRSSKRADVCAEDCGWHGFVAHGRRLMELRAARRRGAAAVAALPAVQPDPGLAIGDVAVSDPHARACLTAAASRHHGCTALRESAKRSRHGEDVRRAGNTFTPIVFSTYGGMGRDAEAWFRGAISVAKVEVPEHVRRSGDEERIAEYEQWARAELSSAWRRRWSVCLHRGNARADP